MSLSFWAVQIYVFHEYIDLQYKTIIICVKAVYACVQVKESIHVYGDRKYYLHQIWHYVKLHVWNVEFRSEHGETPIK